MNRPASTKPPQTDFGFGDEPSKKKTNDSSDYQTPKDKSGNFFGSDFGGPDVLQKSASQRESHDAFNEFNKPDPQGKDFYKKPSFEISSEPVPDQGRKKAGIIDENQEGGGAVVQARDDDENSKQNTQRSEKQQQQQEGGYSNDLFAGDLDGNKQKGGIDPFQQPQDNFESKKKGPQTSWLEEEDKQAAPAKNKQNDFASDFDFDKKPPKKQKQNDDFDNFDFDKKPPKKQGSIQVKQDTWAFGGDDEKQIKAPSIGNLGDFDKQQQQGGAGNQPPTQQNMGGF